MYDLIIIGGGPGGVAAGIYAARKKMKTLLITDTFGGQSVVSADVQNWIGTKSISGFDLAKSLEEHLRAQQGIEIDENDLVTEIQKKIISDDRQIPSFLIKTKKGKEFETKHVLLASGSRHKKLDVPGEKELDGKGVVYCSICDAPLFEGKTVAVVGGGNSALEAVLDAIPYASKIYVLVRSALKGDPVTQDKVKAHPNVEIILGATPEEIIGKDTVTGIRYLANGESKTLNVDGVFVEIGQAPNSDFVKDLVKLDDYGHVAVDHKTQQTSCPGIWAAGDITDQPYRQNNISVGDAVKATLNIYDRVKMQ
ncbi:MAG: FAD-dependent oxidoreductase [Patescibacteria group bacterium]|nr:FAD-dependent oxidoreductase [Patescibacteria group bacterium]